ncbi:unnamed protein product [Camellia sinensis]
MKRNVKKMKGMKGRFLKKLKSISTITSLRQSIVFQANPSHQNFHTDATNIINVPELVNQVKDEEFDSPSHVSEKEKFGSVTESKDIIVPANDHHDIPIVSESGSTSACTVSLPVTQLLTEPETCDFHPILKIDNEEFPTLLDFEEKCPPGGSELVILYTTSLRGIRKTFEDCCSIRFLLESFRVLYHERDVSMHLEFREELWRIAGGRVVPPRLFIKGRHIGGADEVVGLHEQGRLRNLLHGIPPKPYNGPCNGCGGVCFVVCFNCNGSCKVIADEGLNCELSLVRCPECNENGLIKCSICN